MKPLDPRLDPPEADPEIADTDVRRRQRSRALVMALLLGAFVILLYFISIAKMAITG
ncbi:hypothetical protein [Allosphingosinicella indica]|uniref:Uncharacterized protein n=1 Tax=Allosphingosinicella indica TaxID=941907 RepID=A0A1X7GHU5_9SPHN|nr:hypothetical protein [Allosphingosinicella indica]SMF70006.1 hypothetical protein SAMN06295910_1797 [Allosphingosinicella indica]